MAARPDTLEAYQAINKQLVTQASHERGLAFQPRASDVIIAPYAKCGTTWLQQIVHTLRTRGDIDHEDISAVVPWLDPALDLSIDLDADQRGEPRAFKSHLDHDRIPKGGRYIVSMRDPEKALVSLFRFMEGWFFEPGCINLETFAFAEYLEREGGRGYWHHLASWWAEREREDVLMLCYEDMLRDPRSTIVRVARFIDVDLDEALLALTLEHSSRKFMLEHKHLFDDRLMRELAERICALPPGSESAKVRAVSSAADADLVSARVREALAERWRESIAARFSLGSYEAMRAQLRRELG